MYFRYCYETGRRHCVLPSWLLFGCTDCIWFAGCGLFFRQVSVTLVMATDSAATAGGRAGITFGVELVVPWVAPEAVVDLHLDGAMDLDTVPDIIGLTGRQPGAAVTRVLQGRDVRGVCALVPDPRVLERGFHDVTIVDMGVLPEPPVSMDELSLLRRQWPPTVLHHMVWPQQDLDAMHVSPCGYVSLGLRPVVAVSSVLVHGVEGHAAGLHGSSPGAHDVP